MEKYLSIITNFGCHYTCPYCIVKENNLKIPRTTVNGLDELKNEIKQRNVAWVSISGGGDPLHNFKNNEEWWDKLVKEIPLNVKLELHTSYYGLDFSYEAFDRVVYHIRSVNDIKNVKRHMNEIVRVVFVVTEDFTIEKIDKIAREVEMNHYIDELTFRQMVDSDYKSTDYCEKYLEFGHGGPWYYVKQDDYNLYYCENKVTTKFEDFRY